MPRQLSPFEQRELEYLAERTRLIVELMIARSDDSFAASAYMIQHAIDQAVARRDLRGMRIVRSDLLDMSRALSLDDQRDLKKLLEKHGRQDPYSEMAPDEESRRKRARRPRLPPDTDSG